MPKGGFLEHEREENALLRLLRTKEYEDVVEFLGLGLPCAIVVPQSVELPPPQLLTRQFVETHIIIKNPDDHTQFVTLNGACGFITNLETTDSGSLVLLTDPITDTMQLVEFSNDRLSIFKQPVWAAVDGKLQTFHILRVSEVQLRGEGKPVEFFLISAPLTYSECPWSKEALAVRAAQQENQQRAKDTPSKKKPSLMSLPNWGFRFPLSKSTNTDPLSNAPAPAEEPPAADSSSDSGAKNAYGDFHEKMKHPSAYDMVTAIRTFTQNFLDNPPPAEAMSDKVLDFLKHMEKTMQTHNLWQDASRNDFGQAVEGLEKYLMNKLHSKTFAPTAEEQAADVALHSRLEALSFIKPEYLDIKPQFRDETLYTKAQYELNRINQYKAPRDKLVCILNCCKVIFKVLSFGEHPAGADEFLPVLIFVILRTNPPNLKSNLEYILRFRAPHKMMSEFGYYYTNVVSAVHFLETADASALSMPPGEFDVMLEAALLRQRGNREKAQMQAAAQAAVSHLNGDPPVVVGVPVAAAAAAAPPADLLSGSISASGLAPLLVPSSSSPITIPVASETASVVSERESVLSPSSSPPTQLPIALPPTPKPTAVPAGAVVVRVPQKMLAPDFLVDPWAGRTALDLRVGEVSDLFDAYRHMVAYGSTLRETLARLLAMGHVVILPEEETQT